MHIEVHGDEAFKGRHVHPLKAVIGGTGLVDDPVIFGMGVVEIKDVLQQEGDSCGETLGIGVNEAVQLGGVHLGADDVELGLDFEGGDITADVPAGVHIV
ncbi:184R [Mastadenovirus porcusquartum]|uniref:184R n=1 Tax=Mastadenovirus porcusquartum TaxID=3241439 RepID=A0A5P9VII5_9ADEN|nr:184R [Porcine mastadenovirus B]QFX65709.1 184R [Porcine mastadenovirus B]